MNTYVVCNYHTARGHFCIPVGKQKRPGGIPLGLFCFPRSYLSKCIIFCLYYQVININSENASSRKLGNRNWFSQPLVHTVMGRTRALRALVLAHNCMNSWLGKPSSGFPTSWKRYIFFTQNKIVQISESECYAFTSY